MGNSQPGPSADAPLMVPRRRFYELRVGGRVRAAYLTDGRRCWDSDVALAPLAWAAAIEQCHRSALVVEAVNALARREPRFDELQEAVNAGLVSAETAAAMAAQGRDEGRRARGQYRRQLAHLEEGARAGLFDAELCAVLGQMCAVRHRQAAEAIQERAELCRVISDLSRAVADLVWAYDDATEVVVESHGGGRGN